MGRKFQSCIFSDWTSVVNLGIPQISRRPHSSWRTPGFMISDLLPLFFVWFPCVSNLDVALNTLLSVWPWLDTLKPELVCLHPNLTWKTSGQPWGPRDGGLVVGKEQRFCLFLPRPWKLIQILWASKFCLSLEFLISSSSFSDLVLISFYSVLSLGEVCSIQASAYSLLLNTQANIHWIYVALFSSPLNKLSCLLLEATTSPLPNSRLFKCMKNPPEFIFISSATSPWLFSIVCTCLPLSDINAPCSPQKRGLTLFLPCVRWSASCLNKLLPKQRAFRQWQPLKVQCHTQLPALSQLSQTHWLMPAHVRKGSFKEWWNGPFGPGRHVWTGTTVELPHPNGGPLSLRWMERPIYTVSIILVKNLRDNRNVLWYKALGKENVSTIQTLDFNPRVNHHSHPMGSHSCTCQRTPEGRISLFIVQIGT